MLDSSGSNNGRHQCLLVDNNIIMSYISPHASLIVVIIDLVPMLLITSNGGGGCIHCAILMGWKPFFQAWKTAVAISVSSILLLLLFYIMSYVYTTSYYVVLIMVAFVGIELSHTIVILHIYDVCLDTVKN